MRAAVVIAIVLSAAGAVRAESPACGTRPGLQRELTAVHDLAALAANARRAPGRYEEDRDVGDVAVIHDRGDLVIRRNPFDLDGSALRLTPRPGGGYDVARVAIPIEPAGAALSITDGGSAAVDLAFAFPFSGTAHRRAFVHSDGHVTFESADEGGREVSVSRVLDGPPRIAVFFAPLDPSRGGTIGFRSDGVRAVVSWSAIPGAGQINRNTFQAVLHSDGVIDLAWGVMQTREAVVAVTPGRSAAAPVDWSASAARTGAEGALERFGETERMDLVAATRRFLAGRADVFHQVIVYSTRPLNPVAGSLAFEVNVKNDVRGIGLDLMDFSGAWGSGGTLESVVFMDSIDTFASVDGFEFLGHEVGHRWLARLGAPGLLGRGGVHWSFFADTDASVMEGNAIADRGAGRFETVDFARRFSALDQYAMGLRAAAEVPPFFYVDVPDDFRPNRPFKASSAPEAGVRFTGVRRDLTIEDIVRAFGPRVPAVGPPVFRQAFVLVADAGAPATETRIRILDRIRSRFGPWFTEATGGRGTAISTLR